MQRMKFTTLWAIIVAVYVTLSMAKDTDVKIRDDLLDSIGNSTCEGQNNCWKNWIKCAGKLAACAAECMNNTTSQSCISCLTPLYTECKYCFSEIEESRKSGCSPSDWLKCAGVVAECVAQCAEGNTSQTCISRTCLESSYEQCQNCTEAIQKQVAIRIKVHAVQSCSAMQWLKCAGVVAQCAPQCAQGASSQSCISCMGASYNQCKGCPTVIKEIQQHENGGTKVSRFLAKVVQSCNFWQRLECAGVLVACAAVCAFGEIDEPDCIECMGDLYDECKDCFNTLEAIEKQAENGASKVSRFSAKVQGCDVWQMLECAGVMAECAAVCALDIDDPDCIECMGDLYDECKDCFSTIEAIEKQAGCSARNWLKCAGTVAQCAASCAEDISATACISCMGSSYNQCKGCFSLMKQVQKQAHSSMILKATQCKGKLIEFYNHKRNCVNANGKCCASINYGTGNVSRAEKSQEHCGYCFTGVPTYEKCADGGCDFHSKGSSYILKGCDVWQWIECAGVVAACAAVCVGAEYNPDACEECMGGLYDTCKDCFSYVDNEGRLKLDVKV